MQVLFLRHGDRSVGQGSNPSLSETGRRQAEGLVQSVEQNRLAKPEGLWASPKKRTQETLAPLAKTLHLQVEIIADLDERAGQESLEQFQQRVRNVLRRLEKMEKNVILCSHLDWLEEVAAMIPDEGELHLTSVHWSSASYVIFLLDEGHWLSQQQGRV